MDRTMLGYLFLTFIAYSFLGWLLEVVFHIYTEKRLINRGFLHGPLCPIYGTGAIIIIFFLDGVKDNFLYLFLGGVVLTSVLEYITGYVLEKIFNTKWWDYSNDKFNLNGYISLSFSLAWGLGGVFLMRVLQPEIQGLLDLIPFKYVEPLAASLFLIFGFDLILTVSSMISFRDVLKELRELQTIIEDKRDRVEWDNVLSKKLASLNTKLEKRHRELLRAYPNLSTNEIKERLREFKNRKL